MPHTSSYYVAQALAAWISTAAKSANDFAREGLPNIDVEAFFQALGQSGEISPAEFSVALVGFGHDEASLHQLAKNANLDFAALATDLHTATDWRNHRDRHSRIIALATGYNQSVHGLQFFARARSSELARILFRWASESERFGKTPQQKNLLNNLAIGPSLEPLRSLEATAEFLARWDANLENDTVNAARMALPALGVLADPKLFEAPNLEERLTKNLDVVRRLKELSPSDLRVRRKRVDQYKHRETATAVGEVLDRLEALRSGRNAVTSLTLEEAESIVSLPKDPGRRSADPDTTSTSSDIAPEIRDLSADALLEGRQDELSAIADALEEAWTLAGEAGGGRLKASLDTAAGTIEVDEEIDQKVLEWVEAFCGDDRWGGAFTSSVADLKEALTRYAEAEPIFMDVGQAVSYEGRTYSIEDLLKGWDEEITLAGMNGRDLATRWQLFQEKRSALAPYIKLLLSHPREWMDGRPAVADCCRQYLAAAEALYHGIQETYGVVSEASPGYAQLTLEAILALDIVQVKVLLPNDQVASKAVMLPLHPLHLWRHHRLSAVLRNLAKTTELLPDDRTAILEELKRPEHFLSVLRLGGAPMGRGLNQILPVSNDIEGLAAFENLHYAVSGVDGVESLIRAIDYYVLLHPNHPRPLRLALVNPPEPSNILAQLVKLLNEPRYRRGDRLPSIRVEMFATAQHQDRLRAAVALDERVQDLIQEKVAAGRLDLLVSPASAHDLEGLVSEQLQGRHFHLLALFDESTIRLRKQRYSTRLPMSPFCVRHEILVDRRLGHVRLEPQPGSPPFSDFMMMVEALGRGQLDSTTVTSADAEALRAVVDLLLGSDVPVAQWVVLADRTLPSEAGMSAVRLFERRDGQRQVLLAAANYDRLARLMHPAFDRCNLSVTSGRMSGILSQGVHLTGSGLLEVIKKQDGQPDNGKILGFIGALLAARDLQRRYPDCLVVSIDHPLARLWLRLGRRETGERCDLLVLHRDAEAQFTLLCAEVKTTSDASLSDGDARVDHAADQVTATLQAIEEALDTGASETDPLNAPRSEMLKEVLVRTAAASLHDPAQRTQWGNWLRELFHPSSTPSVVNLRGEVVKVVLRSSDAPSQGSLRTKPFALSIRTITEVLAEELLDPSEPDDAPPAGDEPPSGPSSGSSGPSQSPPPDSGVVDKSSQANSLSQASSLKAAPPPLQSAMLRPLDIPQAPIQTPPNDSRSTNPGLGVDESAWPPPVNDLGMIGQYHAVRQLVNQAQKARGWGERFIDKLLVGPAGVGKSTLARKIGELLLGEEAILFNGADLRRPEMIVERLKEIGKVPQDAAGTVSVEPCTIFIDEVHAISGSVATALLSALDDRRTTTVGNVVYQFDRAVFLLATTDPGKLTEAFLSRPDRSYLEPYSLYELAGIVWLHAKRALDGVELDRTTCEEIAARRRCNPRPAVNQLNPLTAHFFGIAQEQLGRVPSKHEVASFMTAEAVAEWFEAQGVDRNGLDILARGFLEVLRKRGAASEDEIRLALGISNRGDFAEVNEYLTRLGLVSTGPGGRSLTREGVAYLGQKPPPDLRSRISRRQ
ncbi:hypothetical protein [Azospirillum argentinense]